MTSITDPDKLQMDLSAFFELESNHAKRLNNVLQDYTKLIIDHRKLKTEYEEATDSRDRYKSIVNQFGLNPFVLVLVDGDGYLFQDHFTRNNGQGGVDAAHELHKQIRAHLSSLGNEVVQARIMVRIYANLKGLSQTLARFGLCGHENRSLAMFACSFTRAQELFDFVDVGEGKERADFKINEMLRLFIDNSQCKHIFFAGCHDNGYVNTLTPYAKSSANRITLVKGSFYSHEYDALRLQVMELPTVFRTSTLETGRHNIKDDTKFYGIVSTSMPTENIKIRKEPCPHYQKGRCWYGESCSFLHPPAISSDSEKGFSSESASPDSLSQPEAAFAVDEAPIPKEILTLMVDKIPVDKSGSRIDLPLSGISSADWSAYSARVKKKRLCNDHILAGSCATRNCPYDHKKVPPNIVHVLRVVVRSKLKCPNAAQCRSRNCYRSHVRDTAWSLSNKSEYNWVPAVG